MPKHSFDIVIVGSGPSGIQAALQCVRAGVRTALVDIGYTEDAHTSMPEKSFTEIRTTEAEQQRFFLGDNPEAVVARQKRAGVHLAPGRMHMIKNMEELLPLSSKTFFALQSTGLGGLGISWGANACAFEDTELRSIGIPPEQLRPYYEHVSRDVGISGKKDTDISPAINQGLTLQPPLPIDTNAHSLLARYNATREGLLKKGFALGQSTLAVLSRPLGLRKANPLFDMDYWSDTGRSVYRPQYTLEEIQKTPELSALFTYLPHRLAVSFTESPDGAVLRVKNIQSGSDELVHAKKLILAAGAINSARIVLQSFKAYGLKLPLLCNHNLWVAAVHMPMLGRPAKDERYSLSQLTSLLKIPERSESGCPDYMLAQFYSYRSLLLSRLLGDIPLPPTLALYFLRLIQTSLTLINVHFSDRPNPLRFLQLVSRDGIDTLEAESSFNDAEKTLFKKYESLFGRALVTLRTLPLGTTRPQSGASIHYAGTLPYSSTPAPATCSAMGKLHGTSHVYVADGSTWKFLPSKGLTLTLMANARRTAQFAVDELKSHA